jgi:hypothetical protein
MLSNVSECWFDDIQMLSNVIQCWFDDIQMLGNVIECWFCNKMLSNAGSITLNVIKCYQMLV